MSSPGKLGGEMVPDLQLNFVFGNSFVKPQTPNTLPEDTEPHELPENYPTETLCLRRCQLMHVAESILKNITLKYLYLEGNQISSVPDSMFTSLPNLLWLDLRNNQMASLPAEIGLHRSLKTLLLEENPIEALPPELGNVLTLSGLNLRNCPITFPPQDIVSQGVQSILQYLRRSLAQRPVNTRRTSPELPEVEKLQLSELMESSMEEQDESVDEGDLQKFRELKDKMMMLDNAELGSIAEGNRKSKSHLLPVSKRKQGMAKAGIIPQLPLFDVQHSKRHEERRQAEKKEKQAILDQRRKSQEALQKWQSQAKTTQKSKVSENKQKTRKRQRKQEDEEAGVEGSSGTQTPSLTNTEFEESRSVRQLERQICARVERIQERRRNPTGTATKQMAAAEQDVEEIRKLQLRLLERKMNRRSDSDRSFIMFTGDCWPSFLDN